ncbi:hypothetical protein QZH41_014274, partial [Actinostola sp. cb2023]
ETHNFGHNFLRFVMSSVEKYIMKIKKKLSSSELEQRKILKYLRHLNDLEVNVEILKNTGIGKVINGLKKHEGMLGDAASNLVLKWKSVVTKEQDEIVPGCSSPKLSLLNSEIDNSKYEAQQQRRMNGRERNGNKMNDKYQDVNKDNSKNKAKAPTLQLCDISFGCEVSSKDLAKQRKKQKLNTSSSTTREKHIANNRFNPSTLSSYLPPLPSVASVNEALLPDIQPTYKPSRLPNFDDSPSKKKRGICTPQQLLHLESCNPDIIEESDELWLGHYRREFKAEKRIDGSSWRESYLMCIFGACVFKSIQFILSSFQTKCQEREEKLEKINAKISASQAAKKPERQVKLAYVTTQAKPPPQIRRKQARYGTGHNVEIFSPIISPVKHRSKTSNPSRPSHASSVVFAPASSESYAAPPPPRRPASAPLLKKTMKMFKNQR